MHAAKSMEIIRFPDDHHGGPGMIQIRIDVDGDEGKELHTFAIRRNRWDMSVCDSYACETLASWSGKPADEIHDKLERIVQWSEHPSDDRFRRWNLQDRLDWLVACTMFSIIPVLDAIPHDYAWEGPQ